LFKNCVFFIGRENPTELLSLIILSGGGIYGDDSDNSSFHENDERITHYIVDRPAEIITMKDNREYVQPQWVFDCLNARRILPVSEYLPGKKLPPHLSPFFEYQEGEYKVKNKLDIEEEEKEEILQNTDHEESSGKLNEMLLSKNKKKLLSKIREEKGKKKKTVFK